MCSMQGCCCIQAATPSPHLTLVFFVNMHKGFISEMWNSWMIVWSVGAYTLRTIPFIVKQLGKNKSLEQI